MGELKRLLPMKEMLVDDIVAYSYMPNELRAKGISLFEYVYVQMKNPKTQQIVGAAFWNERPEVCTFHVVYEDGKNDQEKDILEFVDEVYKMLSTQKDTILEMLSI